MHPATGRHRRAVTTGARALSSQQPTDAERWVSEGGWLVELLLPRTDAGVLAQAVAVALAFALLLPSARRAAVLQLWAGAAVFTAGLFMLRAVH